MIPVTITILAKDSQKHLEKVLAALSSFDEVIVADTGSTDATLEIAAKFANVTIHHLKFSGFGPTHNAVSALAKHDWILSVDSDEELSKELVDEIFTLELECGSVYSFPRKNFYRGVFIKSCGWHPDRVFRLYHRRKTGFSNDQVHEGIITQGLNKIDLKGCAYHTPYEDVSDFLRKMQLYTSLFAKQYKGKRKGSLFKALLHGKMAFFKAYILKKGIFQGGVGFEISFYNGVTAFYKYLKLRDLSEKN